MIGPNCNGLWLTTLPGIVRAPSPELRCVPAGATVTIQAAWGVMSRVTVAGAASWAWAVICWWWKMLAALLAVQELVSARCFVQQDTMLASACWKFAQLVYAHAITTETVTPHRLDRS